MLNLLSRILYLTFLIIVIIGISKLYLPLSENDYERILNNDEIVIGIRTGPASYYEIKNQNNDLICTGSSVLAFMNMETMKPTRCPKYLLNLIDFKSELNIIPPL